MLKRRNFSSLFRVYTDNLSFTGICVYQTGVKCYIRKVYLGGIYSAVTDPSTFSVIFDFLWYNRRAEELTGVDSFSVFECLNHCVRIKIDFVQYSWIRYMMDYLEMKRGSYKLKKRFCEKRALSLKKKNGTVLVSKDIKDFLRNI